MGVLDILPKKRRMGVEGRENTKCERERRDIPSVGLLHHFFPNERVQTLL